MIPLFRVFSPPNIGARLQDVFDSGVVSEGAHADLFEAQFSLFVGNPNVALVNSCTSAITLALRLCNVGPDDVVLSTPMTCMATNEPIHNAGARIEWIDIDPTTGNMDPDDARRRLLSRGRVRAIMAVHWAGQPFDCATLQALGDEFGVPLIADAAHALGATSGGQDVSCWGDYVCYSFQAIKHLTTGDGGALACRRTSDFERARLLRWFGIDRRYPGSKWKQDIVEAGYKFHMNNINACIGIEQLRYVDGIISAHRANGLRYDAGIDNPHITKLRREPGTVGAQWLYSVLVDDPGRFQEHMASQGVAADVVHVRNDRYSVFQRYSRFDLPGVDSFCSRLSNIPVGWWLSPDDVTTVITVCNSYRP